MKALSLHSWEVTPSQAQQIQLELADRVSARNELGQVRRVAGADIAIDRKANKARAAVVVLSFPEMALLETRVVERAIAFPYVPGLLSFREAPAVLEAFEKLDQTPDLLLADGQGLAHPRRFGLACHLGVLLGLPAVGCAKSLLVGQHGLVPEEAGLWTEIMDKEEVVGAALRIRAGSKPIYVSVGHRVDLSTAVRLVLECTRGYRLPEPTRLAHLAAAAPAGHREAAIGVAGAKIPVSGRLQGESVSQVLDTANSPADGGLAIPDIPMSFPRRRESRGRGPGLPGQAWQ